MIEEAAAAFLLLFESEVVSADMAPPPPSLGSARLDGGGAEVNVNAWFSSQDRVQGGTQDSNAAGHNAYHINSVLHDRRRGRVDLHGDAYSFMKEPEPEPYHTGLVISINRSRETVG